MIYSFDKKDAILFFPKGWGNSVVLWISGIKSPSGTLKIRNTLAPTEKGSLEIDVNIHLLAKRVREVLAEKAKAK